MGEIIPPLLLRSKKTFFLFPLPQNTIQNSKKPLNAPQTPGTFLKVWLFPALTEPVLEPTTPCPQYRGLRRSKPITMGFDQGSWVEMRRLMFR